MVLKLLSIVFSVTTLASAFYSDKTLNLLEEADDTISQHHKHLDEVTATIQEEDSKTEDLLTDAFQMVETETNHTKL